MFLDVDVRLDAQAVAVGVGFGIGAGPTEMTTGGRFAMLADAGPDTTTSTRPAVNEADLKVTRVLLLEDHPDTRNAIVNMLRWNGFTVRPASTVAEAISAMGEERFDLIVSDIGLPDGSGLDVMRYVRQNLGINGIAFSAYGTDDDIRAGQDAGFVHYLVKPVNVAMLIRLIRELTAN